MLRPTMKASRLRDSGTPYHALSPPGAFLETQVSRLWFHPQSPCATSLTLTFLRAQDIKFLA